MLYNVLRPPVFRIQQGGMTLLEVILALALLGGSIAVIGRLAHASYENARWTKDIIQAELLAESILAKVRLGIIEMESAADTPVGNYVNRQDEISDTYAVSEGDASSVLWFYSLEVQNLDEYLVELAVTVRQNVSADQRPAVCRLVRWACVPMESERSP